MHEIHEKIMEGFDALEDGEVREMWAAGLKRVLPEELTAELRTAEQLAEGFCIAAEGVGSVALMVMSDCRERVRRAREIARQGAGA